MSELDQAPDAPRAAAEAQRSRVVRALKQCALLERAARATRDAMAVAASLEVVPGGAALFRQGDRADALVVLSRGRVRLERATDGGAVFPLGYRGAGEVLGESCLGGVDVRTETAAAMEETEIALVPRPLVLDLAASDAALGGALLGLVLVRQREVEDRVASMLLRNVEGRLCEFLLKAAERWGVPSPQGVLISAPITHLEIAQVIGSTRETVTLTLGALRREGVMDVSGRRLVICDREALARRL